MRRASYAQVPTEVTRGDGAGAARRDQPVASKVGSRWLTCEYASCDDCSGWQDRALVIASARRRQPAARSRERGAPPPDQPGPRPAGRCSGREVNGRCYQAFTPGAPALLRQPKAQRPWL